MTTTPREPRPAVVIPDSVREGAQAAADALASVTDADRARVAAVLPGLPIAAGHRVAALLAEQRAELADTVAATLAAYDEAAEDWQKVTEAEERTGEPPSVKDCERYSDRLENCAHAFAHVLRDLVEQAPAVLPAAAVDVLDAVRAELHIASANGDASTVGDYAADTIAALMRRYDVGQDEAVEESADLAAALAANAAKADALAPPTEEERAAELARAVADAGIEPADLDALTHEAASQAGSNANNGGTFDQVALLVRAFGVDGARQVIQEETGRSLPIA